MQIINHKHTIDQFQLILADSLKANGFTEEQVEFILRAATLAFLAIAKEYPIKPKTIPDSGLDVKKTLSKISPQITEARQVVWNNPTLLFITHGISVPTNYNMAKLSDVAPHKAPPTIKKLGKEDPLPPLRDIVAAGIEHFNKHNFRPIYATDVIKQGSLIGIKWAHIEKRIRNNRDFSDREGFESLAQLFDVAMIGKRHKAIRPQEAREAFCNALDRLVRFIPGDNPYITGEPPFNPPYLLQILEESLAAMSTQDKTKPDRADYIDKGPLAGMNLICHEVNEILRLAISKNDHLPFSNLQEFIAHHRGIEERQRQQLRQHLQ